MKKLLFSLILVLASSFSGVIAQITNECFGEEIALQASIIDPTKGKGPIKRSPVRVPSIGIDDHTLHFITSCDGCTLRLFNEDGDMVIDMIIPDNSSTINLPNYLTGEYEIQIIRGNYRFYGYIDF